MASVRAVAPVLSLTSAFTPYRKNMFKTYIAEDTIHKKFKEAKELS